MALGFSGERLPVGTGLDVILELTVRRGSETAIAYKAESRPRMVDVLNGATPLSRGRICLVPELSPDDAELDALWRKVFGQPLPMRGSPEIARKILADHMAKDSR